MGMIVVLLTHSTFVHASEEYDPSDIKNSLHPRARIKQQLLREYNSQRLRIGTTRRRNRRSLRNQEDLSQGFETTSYEEKRLRVRELQNEKIEHDLNRENRRTVSRKINRRSLRNSRGTVTGTAFSGSKEENSRRLRAEQHQRFLREIGRRRFQQSTEE